MKHSASTLRQIVLSVLTVFLLVFSAVSAYTLCTPEQDERVPLTSSQSSELSGDRRGDASEVSATARRRGVENILICGKDRASGLCDVIIVARLDTSNHSASLVQIPRDTYAAYTEKDYRKLNGAPTSLGGVRGLADFLSRTLGVPIDHYALVDLDCIGDTVDAIGGVTLTVPTDMDYEDKSQDLSIHLKAGRQTLDGDLAEQFLRFRSGYASADLGRLDAQKLFLSAFLSEVKENCTLPTIIRIVRTLYGRVETDLTLGDCIRLASVGMKLSPERLTMETLPGEAARTNGDSGAWYYILHRDAAFDTVNRLLNLSESPLSPARFDPEGRFTSEAYPHFDAIYHGEHRSGDRSSP